MRILFARRRHQQPDCGASEMRAISYIRFSTPEQAEGTSLARQLEKTRDYCARHGLVLDESDMLRDEGMSAFSSENDAENVAKGALGTFLEKVQAGQVEKGTVLIVERLDRLSRQEPMAAMSLFSEIVKNGITLITLEDGQRYDVEKVLQNPMILFGSLAALIGAYYESKKKADWVSSAWDEKRKKARIRPLTDGRIKPLTKIRPAWLDIGPDGEFVLNRDAKRIITRIFEEAAAGIGCYTIARRLQDDGEPTLSGEKLSNGWNKSRVLEIVRTDRVLGWFQPHKRKGNKRIPVGEPIKDYYPPVVSQNLADRARAALDSKSFGGAGSGNKGPTFSNLFAGIAICAECGGPMHLLHKNRHFGGYLRCWRAFRGADKAEGVPCSNRGSIPYVRLEKAVLRDVDVLERLRKLMPKSDGVGALEEEIALKQKEVSILKTAMRNMREEFAKRNVTLKVLTDQIVQMGEQVTALEPVLADLNRQLNAERVRSSEDAFGEIRQRMLADMGSPLPEVRYKSRSRVALALREIFAAIVCAKRSVRFPTTFLYDRDQRDKRCVISGGYDFNVSDELSIYYYGSEEGEMYLGNSKEAWAYVVNKPDGLPTEIALSPHMKKTGLHFGVLAQLAETPRPLQRTDR